MFTTHFISTKALDKIVFVEATHILQLKQQQFFYKILLWALLPRIIDPLKTAAVMKSLKDRLCSFFKIQ